MNEYQCRNYIAEQILEEMGKNVIKRRVGKPFTSSGIDKVFNKRNQDMRTNFMYDVGSTNYQEWLAKYVGYFNNSINFNMILIS